MLFYGIEDPETGIGGITREQDHFHAFLTYQGIQVKQLLYQVKGIARFKYLVLVFNLVMAVSINTLLDINTVTIIQVEQRPGRDSNDEFAWKSFSHN